MWFPYFDCILFLNTGIAAETEKFHVSSLCPMQISSPVDYSNPPTVKNHNEVLRSFSLLGTEAFIFAFSSRCSPGRIIDANYIIEANI